jgi:hypothetical protein
MSRAILLGIALAFFAAGCDQLANRLTPVSCGQDNYFKAIIAGPDGDWACPAYTPPGTPTTQPEGLYGGDGGTCAPATGDDACTGCVKASCCELSVACFKDPACLSTGGPAYEAAADCITEHCAADCPELP